jgi:hypothetical protein
MALAALQSMEPRRLRSRPNPAKSDGQDRRMNTVISFIVASPLTPLEHAARHSSTGSTQHRLHVGVVDRRPDCDRPDAARPLTVKQIH